MEPDERPTEVAQCALCGEVGRIGRVIPIVTALRMSSTRKTGFKEYTTTTTTTGFKDHHRKVCEGCVAGSERNRRTLMIVTAALLAIIIPASIASQVAWGWIVLAVLVVIGLVGRYDEAFIDLEQRTKKATAGAKGSGVIGFTEAEFKAYAKKNQR